MKKPTTKILPADELRLAIKTAAKRVTDKYRLKDGKQGIGLCMLVGAFVTCAFDVIHENRHPSLNLEDLFGEIAKNSGVPKRGLKSKRR